MFNKMTMRERVMRKFGTTRIIVLSFLLVIMIGAVFLWLPVSSKADSISFLDSLFISTSATCVTGLVPVSLYEQFNIFGLTVILILIQIGGLGLMSLIAFIMTIMKHQLHQSEKKLIQDALNKKDMQDVPRFLKSIVKYTCFFEGFGALLLMIRFVPEYGLMGVYHAIFLSVSAFCNAGMDSFSSVSLMPYSQDLLINIVISLLIIVGGLGFAVWIDLEETIKYKFQKKSKRSLFKSITVHTRIVLSMTAFLLVSGTVLIFISEYHNAATIGNLSLFEKLQASFFQSVTLRTAGSVPLIFLC